MRVDFTRRGIFFSITGDRNRHVDSPRNDPRWSHVTLFHGKHYI